MHVFRRRCVRAELESGGLRSLAGEGAGDRADATAGRADQQVVESSGGSGSQGGVRSEGGKGANTGSGLAVVCNGGETSGINSSDRANISTCGKKRSTSVVSSSSKRGRSEVWVLAGGSDGKRRCVDQEKGKGLSNVAAGEISEPTRVADSTSSETPRSTTVVAYPFNARRRLPVLTPDNDLQRSQTMNQALSSIIQRNEGVVTIGVVFLGAGGMETHVTYKVKMTTPMQKVLDKVVIRTLYKLLLHYFWSSTRLYLLFVHQVAVKMGKRGDQVMLSKDGCMVDSTAMAAIYTNTKLAARVIGSYEAAVL